MHSRKNTVDDAADRMVDVLLAEHFGDAPVPDLSQAILERWEIETRQAGSVQFKKAQRTRFPWAGMFATAATVFVVAGIGYRYFSNQPSAPQQAKNADSAAPIQLADKQPSAKPPADALPVSPSVAPKAVAPRPSSDQIVNKSNTNKPNLGKQDNSDLRISLDHLPFGKPTAPEKSAAENSTAVASSPSTELQPLPDAKIIAHIDRELSALWIASGFEAPKIEAGSREWQAHLAQMVGTTSRYPGGASSDPLSAVRAQAEALGKAWLRLLLPSDAVGQMSKDQEAFLVGKFADSFRGSTPWNQEVAELFTVSSHPDSDATANDAPFLAALGSPRGTSAVEQVGHMLFNEDLVCARCHDHPLKSQISQSDYWSIAAVFQNQVRWFESEGSIRAAANTDSEATALFYDTLEGLRRVASPAIPARYQANSSEAKLSDLVAAAERSGALATTTINLLWQLVYQRPLAGTVVNPDTPPIDPHLESIHQFLAEQLIAHKYDVGQALAWILQTRPLQQKALEQDGRVLSSAEIELADRRARLFLNPPVYSPAAPSNQLLALVSRWNAPAGIAGESSILAQAENSKPPVTASFSQIQENRLRATFPVKREILPVSWLSSIGSYEEQSRHVFYLAKIGKPTPRHMEMAAAILTATTGDATTALHQLWWVLKHRNNP